MREYKVKAKVINNFNDKNADGVVREKDEIIEVSRARFEELSSKGFVEKIEIKNDLKKLQEKENED